MLNVKGKDNTMTTGHLKELLLSSSSSSSSSMTCSGIDALPSFPGASTISSSSRFVVEGVFRKSGVVHSFKMVDPVLFVFDSQVQELQVLLTAIKSKKRKALAVEI